MIPSSSDEKAVTKRFADAFFPDTFFHPVADRDPD
jgi:hypothetical protein